jgi:hypothetical protein
MFWNCVTKIICSLCPALLPQYVSEPYSWGGKYQ